MGTSPAALARNEIDVLLARMGGVRDGDVEDVHQARISTRRLRELLPLVTAETGAQTDTAADLLRTSGRMLGVVRELDTLIELCARLTDQSPPAAAVLAVCRAQLMTERHDSARWLLKGLEQQNVQRLRRLVPRGSRPALRPWHRAPSWHAALGERLDIRAEQLKHTVERTGGVYMPNRVHRVRIALKKLRYAVEVARATGHWRPPRLLRDTRRLQDRLGAIHDREVLLRRLTNVETRDGLGDQIRMLSAILRAGILEQYAQFRERRDRLPRIIAACQTHAHGDSRPWLMPGARLASALVVPVGIACLGRRERVDAVHSGVRGLPGGAMGTPSLALSVQNVANDVRG